MTLLLLLLWVLIQLQRFLVGATAIDAAATGGAAIAYCYCHCCSVGAAMAPPCCWCCYDMSAFVGAADAASVGAAYAAAVESTIGLLLLAVPVSVLISV